MDPAQAAELERNFKALMLAGVITNVDAKEFPPRVFVGAGWYELSFQQKVAAAKLVSDYWASVQGHPGGAALFDLCDGNSGRVLYKWDYIELKPQ